MKRKKLPLAQTIINTEENIRIDRFLRRLFKYLPQGVLQKSLRSGDIKVNGKKVEANHRLNINDSVYIFHDFSEYQSLPQTGDDAVLSSKDRAFIEDCIIFEDDEICIFNKPSGLAVQGGTDTKTHVDGIMSLYKKGTTYRLVHRLDKDTSGVLVLAKTAQMANFLGGLFKEKTIEKQYIAVVHGTIKEKEGYIDVPLLKDFKGHKEQMVVSPKGKKAVTQFLVLAQKQNFSLVLLKPLTGRTHQLRVHMAHIGHPIVGDYKYGSTMEQGHRLHLHAKSIIFPYGPRKIASTFEAPIPTEDMFGFFDVI